MATSEIGTEWVKETTMRIQTSAMATHGIVLTVSAALALGHPPPRAKAGSTANGSELAPACSVSGAVIEVPPCHLEIIEVPAGDLGPDLGNGGFWVEDYIGQGMFDTLVSVGSCDGRCILGSVPTGSDLHCIPTAHKPVRIENHSYAGVTPWRVWVPSECGCGKGVGIDYFSLLPVLESLNDLVSNVLGDTGTGGAALRDVFVGLADLDGAPTEALIRGVIDLTTPVFALEQAPETLRRANQAKIPMTPALRAELEKWVWSRTRDAIAKSLDHISLSAPSRATVMQRLRQEFPNVFAR